MIAWKSILTALVLLLVPAGVQAASEKGGPEPGPDVAVFCEGPYALCIKAPCVPVANADGSVTTVVCSCTVQKGWSMGPAQCPDRRALKHGSTTHLMSTYSNYDNTPNNQNLTCKGNDQAWANCYGAPCVSDASTPDRAHCNCPVKQGEMVVLTDKCGSSTCNELWSAATPKENTFANNHFWNYMKEHHPDNPTRPPAKVCGAI